MCAVCVEKMSAYEIYGLLRKRQSRLIELKKAYASYKGELDAVVAEMTYKEASLELSKKANDLREMAESTMREIKAIEICSRSIGGLDEVIRPKSKNDQRKPFRDCVTQFVFMKGDETFEPTELAKFVAEARGQSLTNSVRVFTHRILKDLVLQNRVTQIAHGLYASSNSPKAKIAQNSFKINSVHVLV